MPEERVQHSAVINPYALADVVAGRPIPWKRIPDPARVLEQVLQTPYEELFDPVYDSPLYLGLRLNDRLELEPARTPLLDVDPSETGGLNDFERLPNVDPGDLRRLGDLAELFEVGEVADIPITRAESIGFDTLRLDLTRPGTAKPHRLARVITRDIAATVAFDPQRESKDFTPPNAYWGDLGRFFNEAAEFFDPIQGAVANCYLIAAMASVAWAKPYLVSHLTRATGQAQEQFANLIRFRDIDQGNALQEVEVTDRVPLSSASGLPIYCRSSEAGETWPALYEKAFAKWKTSNSGDSPDITATAWGDCVRAAAELTGMQRHYFATTSLSADQLWDKVRQHSAGGRTFHPMVAATYSTGEAAEKKVTFGDANLVASHCYSVLGWAYRDGSKYLILRNPWGHTEATAGTLGGTEYLHDISWWRPIVLADADGVFALHAATFKQYFSTLGAVT